MGESLADSGEVIFNKLSFFIPREVIEASEGGSLLVETAHLF